MTSTQSLNILVVEDDFNLQESILDVLRGRGYHVRGIDCADAIPEQRDMLLLDLVIVDINLPGEDGLSLVKRLREAHPNLGIIILSARSQANYRIAGYAHGADIYITKPASLKELDTAVLALARRLHPKVGQINHQRFILYPTDQTLKFDKRTILLTKNEVNLLVAWVHAPQNILRHSEIAETLKIKGRIKKPLIELYVSRLRKKIPIPEDTLASIRSVHGQGYKLCISVVLSQDVVCTGESSL